MNWILEHLQILLGAAAAIAYFLNRRRQPEAEDENPPSPAKGVQVSEEQAERTRRVQEEIRRKIAERRGEALPAGVPEARRERIPPLVKPTTIPPLDPFGGPMRRVIRKIEDAAAKLERPTDYDAEKAARAEELNRQAKLAEQLRQLELARTAQERRTSEIMLARRQKAPGLQPMPGGYGDVRAALRNPRDLRRAVILREVLNSPPGLR